MIKAEVIKNLHLDGLNYVSGNLDNIATRVSQPTLADKNSLVFVSLPDQLKIAISKQSPIIIAHHSLTLPEKTESTLFTTVHTQRAMAQVMPLFDGKMNRFSQKEKIHSTSIIHESAHIGKNVSIGPFVVVGENAKIGDHSTLGAHCVIESYAEVGDHTLLHPQVFIGSHCTVGNHCEIHPHTTIGSDGYGYAPDPSGHFLKIPQLGRVRIGHSVEIGSQCAIDRSTLHETVIGDGTKVDNLCHIAHNCEIGANCLITAGFMTAGSTKIGHHFMTGGNSVVADHITIADNVTLAGRSTVTRNIDQPGAYGGYPTLPMKDHLRILAVLPTILKIKKQVALIAKHLKISDVD